MILVCDVVIYDGRRLRSVTGKLYYLFNCVDIHGRVMVCFANGILQSFASRTTEMVL